mmetsp:Transcript_93119/g.272515  ORF Transcript_93119/g.272515 Transcript_93119/m.272515 type:complete len:308 (+) Transcript_93119:1154-2077(+)
MMRSSCCAAVVSRSSLRRCFMASSTSASVSRGEPRFASEVRPASWLAERTKVDRLSSGKASPSVPPASRSCCTLSSCFAILGRTFSPAAAAAFAASPPPPPPRALDRAAGTPRGWAAEAVEARSSLCSSTCSCRSAPTHCSARSRWRPPSEPVALARSSASAPAGWLFAPASLPLAGPAASSPPPASARSSWDSEREVRSSEVSSSHARRKASLAESSPPRRASRSSASQRCRAASSRTCWTSPTWRLDLFTCSKSDSALCVIWRNSSPQSLLWDSAAFRCFSICFCSRSMSVCSWMMAKLFCFRAC